ncbi:unnamed protein product, partial [Dibothriocephalus latus]
LCVAAAAAERRQTINAGGRGESAEDEVSVRKQANDLPASKAVDEEVDLQKVHSQTSGKECGETARTLPFPLSTECAGKTACFENDHSTPASCSSEQADAHFSSSSPVSWRDYQEGGHENAFAVQSNSSQFTSINLLVGGPEEPGGSA